MISPTKLHQPAVQPGAIARPRLLDQLNRAGDLPLTLICAPAGYGKTVLASQWLQSAPHEHAWMSLDEDDAYLGAFVGLFAAALETVSAGALQGTRQLLNAPRPVAPGVLQARLVNELDELSRPVIVVVDDYQRASSEEVSTLVSGLLAHSPRHLHLALLSRVDPPIELSGLRGHGKLTEIRAEELGFSRKEIAEVLKAKPGLEATAEAVSACAHVTEGWPAGVRLWLEASRNRRPGSEPPGGAALLDSVHARDFLAAEVLEAQPPAVRAHLLASSVLDRFCAPLCDAVAEADAGSVEGEGMGGSEFVAWLERADLFVAALDSEHEWFRFHHLFQAMLQRRLLQVHGPERVRDTHRRASEWLSDAGLVDEAFRQAVRAGDEDAIARLGAQRGRSLPNDERWVDLGRWLERIPGDLAERDPELLVLEAWRAGDVLSEYERMGDLLGRVEALVGEVPESGSDFVLGSIEALRGMQSYQQGDSESAARQALRATELIPAEDARCLAFASILEIVTLQATGRPGDATAFARSKMRDDRFRSTRFPPWTWGMCIAWWCEADMVRSGGEASELSRHGRTLEMPDTVGHAECYLGASTYMMDRPSEATTHFSAVADLRDLTQLLPYVHSVLGLSLCHLAENDEPTARDAAETAHSFARTTTSAYLHGLTDWFLVEVDLRGGRLGAAERWLKAEGPAIESVPWMLYQPATTAVKALLEVATDETRERAGELIAENLDFAERTHHRPLLIQMLGLRALLEEALGQEVAALSTLGRAVSISQPGRALRFLADLGPHLAGPLNRLEVEGEELAHTAAILAALGATSQAEELEPGRRTPPDAVDLPGIEPLTERETDVLALLQRRYSNKEIARDLLIAPETVKKHSINLYRKLNVSGRRNAVEKAQALGYLGER